MIGTITLNPSIDQHIFVRNLVKDDANRALSILRFPGGKGVNVSKVVKELGGRTTAHALIGGCAGALWLDLARKEGISYRSYPVKGETRINTILTDLADHTQTRVSAPGPKVSSREVKALLGHLLLVRPKPRFWALGGSLSAGMPASTYRDLIIALQKNGTPCILDTDNDALKHGIDAKPFMIKPNEYEMQRLLGRTLGSVQSYLDAAVKLVHGGIRVVVVSLGARGALFVKDGEAIHVTTPKVPIRSKVGAGDSLIGGFVFALAKGDSFEKAAATGVAASTSAVMKKGTKLCDHRDIPGLLRRVHVRRLY